MLYRELLASLVSMASLTIGACNGAAAAVDESLQGIVEHDERVLGFPVGGRIDRVEVDRGSVVHAGQILVHLDESLEAPMREARLAEIDGAAAQLGLVRSGPRREEVRAAEAELRAISDQIGLLRGRRDRHSSLVDHGALASASLEDLDGTLASLGGRSAVVEERLALLRRGARGQEVDVAEAQLRAARAGLAAIDTRLALHSLSSPGDFTVTDLHASVGEIAGPGTAAVTLADLDHPYVDVYVPEGRITRVAVGQRATVRVDGLRNTLTGVVEYVSNRTEFTPRFLFSESERPNLVLRVRVRVDDRQHVLRAGLPAFVTLGNGRETAR